MRCKNAKCSSQMHNNFEKTKTKKRIYRGSYMSAHVLLNLLNELGKRDKNARLAEHFISFLQRF